MTPEERVRLAARRANTTRNELVVAIRSARADGLTLRAIADAAGMSHEQVRRIASQ